MTEDDCIRKMEKHIQNLDLQVLDLREIVSVIKPRLFNLESQISSQSLQLAILKQNMKFAELSDTVRLWLRDEESPPEDFQSQVQLKEKEFQLEIMEISLHLAQIRDSIKELQQSAEINKEAEIDCGAKMKLSKLINCDLVIGQEHQYSSHQFIGHDQYSLTNITTSRPGMSIILAHNCVGLSKYKDEDDVSKYKESHETVTASNFGLKIINKSGFFQMDSEKLIFEDVLDNDNNCGECAYILGNYTVHVFQWPSNGIIVIVEMELERWKRHRKKMRFDVIIKEMEWEIWRRQRKKYNFLFKGILAIELMYLSLNMSFLAAY